MYSFCHLVILSLCFILELCHFVAITLCPGLFRTNASKMQTIFIGMGRGDHSIIQISQVIQQVSMSDADAENPAQETLQSA